MFYRRFCLTVASVLLISFLFPNTVACAADQDPQLMIKVEREYDTSTKAVEYEVIDTYEYNEQGQLTKNTQRSSYDYRDTITADYSYYNDGSLREIHYDDGKEIIYEYYGNGVVKSKLTSYEGGESGNEEHYDIFGTYMDSLPWEPFDGTRGDAIPINPKTCQRVYDDRNRLVRFETGEYAGRKSDTYYYFYDEQGRILRVESDWQIIIFTYAEDGSYTIRWNRRDKESDKLIMKLSFEEEYDANGNILRYRYTYADYRDNATDFGINYAYNFNGNLLLERGWGYGSTFGAYSREYSYFVENDKKTVKIEYFQDRLFSTERHVYYYDIQSRLIKEEYYYCDLSNEMNAEEVLVRTIKYEYSLLESG